MLEQHGGSFMMERAFAGFAQLPAPGARKHWSAVMNVPRDASRHDVECAYKRLAKKHHPDNGGSTELMAEPNAAKAEAMKELGQ
jgi:hypothetical protein